MHSIDSDVRKNRRVYSASIKRMKREKKSSHSRQPCDFARYRNAV